MFCFIVDICGYEYSVINLTYTIKQDLKSVFGNRPCVVGGTVSGQVATFISEQIVTLLERVPAVVFVLSEL